MNSANFDDGINFYEIIGVSESASFEVIKKSYRAKLLKVFPDKLPLGASESDRLRAKEEFLQLEAAWSVLSNTSKRKEYDAYKRGKSIGEDHPSTGEIALEEMEFDEGEDIYYYECRCGGEYVLEDLPSSSSSVISCNTCSLTLKVCHPQERQKQTFDSKLDSNEVT